MNASCSDKRYAHANKAAPLLILLALIIALLLAPIAHARLVARDIYLLGESVALEIPAASDPLQIVIDAPNGKYRLLDGTGTTFTPTAIGNHTITALGPDGQIIDQDAFAVIAPPATQGYAITVGDDPHADEDVMIRIDPQPAGPVEVTIRTASGNFRYAGPWVDSPFTPRSEGSHEILLSQDGKELARYAFTVGPARPAPSAVIAPEGNGNGGPQAPVDGAAGIGPGPDRGNLSPGVAASGTVEFTLRDGKDRRTSTQAHLLRKRSGADGDRYDVELDADQRVAHRILIRDLRLEPSMTAGVAQVSTDSIKDTALRRTGPILKAYAIDLGGLNFSDAIVTGVAQGTVLSKCALWDFSTQTCRGSWVKIADLVPGQEYSITIYPGDPGFAETGVATVNSRKPIYLPNETAELLMVVLNTGGYLVSNASIVLRITDPMNGTQTRTTQAEQILEIERGVYRTFYTGTSYVGNYTLIVNATAPGVGSVLGSSFAVSVDHPFDILRDTPVTTDPFQGPFNSTITIVPRTDADEYDLTEVLPAEFTVVDAGGATVSGDSASTYLTWTGLSGSQSVEYSARPPLVTPALFALGKAFVTYVQDSVTLVFEEARAWFLAIDPEVTRDQGLVVYGDRSPDGSVKFRNWTGTLLQGEQDSGLDFVDRTTWFRFRCLKARGECLLLASDGGNDLNFAVFDTNLWAWRNFTQLDSNIGQDDQMQFDVECEDNSGVCLIAYEDATTGNNNFQARIWNASGLQSASAYTVTGGENNDFQWLELYPQKGTNRIGIALQNDGGGANTDTPAVYGGIWNGSTFVNWSALTTTGPAQGNGRTFFKHYDCGWEGNTSDFVCFYGENNLNGVEAQRWHDWAWTNLGTIYGATGDEVLEVAVCGQEPWSDFNHSALGVFFCDDAADLDGGIWNGTALNKTATTETPNVNTNAECGSNKAVDEWGRNFECRWERTGDQAIFVWVAGSGQDWITAGTYTRSTKTWSIANWTTGTQIVADAAGDIRMVQLSPNQESDAIFLVYADGSSDGGCSDWTGTSWDGTGCNNQLVFETSGARPARQWITFDWFRTPPPQPEITIYRPNGTHTSINFSGILSPSSTSRMEENLTTTALPPTGTSAPLPGTEVPSAAYVNISASDDNRRGTVITTTGGQRATQVFNFSVIDSAISMSEIVLTHEGRATQGVAQAASNFDIYVYNWTSDAYVLERTVFASATDVLSEITITSGFTDYVRGRQMLVLVEGQFATAGGGNARAEIMTDFIGLSIDSIAVLRANVTVNASAVDDDGVATCNWSLINLSGIQIGNTSPLPLHTAPYYVNINDTRLYPDGTYDLTVICTDTLGNRRNASERVRIDNTPPNVTLFTPGNATNLSLSHAVFSWNTTDIPGENLVCNATIDTTVSATNVVSPHGENTSRNITSIADGAHNWSVTCADDAGNRNVSDMWNFTVDTKIPGIALVAPSNNGYSRTTTVNFTYTPSDANGLFNCTIRLDNSDNMTVLAPTSGVTTNFTIPDLDERQHLWNITCFDNFAKQNTSNTRNFTVDATLPTIYLNTTNGITFNNTPAVLNFTAVDNIDMNLTCNITVNGTVVVSNIGAANNTLVSRSVTLEDGDHSWNVTCVDDAGNANTSQTRYFRVLGGPIVTLRRPGNASVNNGLNVNFTYYVQDGDGVANCSLIIDNIVNQTSLSITNNANNSFIANLTEGQHLWSVNCTDNMGTVGQSVSWYVSADNTPPSITLNLPNPGQILNVTPTAVNFTMTDNLSPNATCNLTIDNAVAVANQNFVVLNNTLTTRTQTVVNGLHYWNVTCVDLGGNYFTSATRNFTVNVTFPLTVNVTTDKKQYQEGEIVYVNISVRNETNRPVGANGTTDLIFTNATATDLSWWNVSWARRKPIYINETSNVARAGKPVAVNLTGLYGGISNCVTELRVIGDGDLLPVAFNVLGGDDVTWCYIQFNATVGANQNNQQNYHAYFNNSGAVATTYPSLTAATTIFSDAFANLASWTAGTGWDISTGDPLPGNHAHIDGSVTDTNLTLTTALNVSAYDNVNVTFDWEIDGSWDAGEYIYVRFSNTSGTTWSGNLSSLWGGIGAVSRTDSFILNSSYRVNGLSLRFQATVSGGTEDGGVDNVNISASNSLQNVSAWAGETQIWILRNVTDVNATGNITLNLTTLGRWAGNYSVAARYTSPTGLNSPGSGWDWFKLVADVFGPVITIVQPTNGSTNHTGQISFIYIANDVANDVANCTITIDGVVNGTNSTAINETGNNTHLANLTEGRHTWQVNCTDVLGNNGNSTVITFFLDDTPPQVQNMSPNGTTLSSTNVTFSFNATDNLDTRMECVINLTGPSNRTAWVNATNSTLTTTSLSNLSEGQYSWNVTCWDNINNTVTSGNANFTIDQAPIPSLFFPPDDYGVNATDIALFYNVSDSTIANCTLLINGTFNQTNSTPLLYTSNDGNNNFTLTGAAYGRYNWTVICYDQNGFAGTTVTWRFQLDNDVPNVTLNRPTANETVYTTSVVFNWTVIDTDPSPTCNLTLDGVLNQSNIAANESSPTYRIVTGVGPGNHSWGVTCWDGAGYANVSETRNFTVDTTVSVVLSSPANNTIDGDGSVSFKYTPQSLAGFTLGFCDLYLDNISNATHIGLTSGAQDTFSINGIPDGTHGWYVNCTDSAGSIGLSATWYILIDLQDPVVTPHEPNGTAFPSNSVAFNWTATDNLDLNMTCNVRVNGTLQTPGNINTPNATPTNRTYSGFTDGFFIWNVTCTDDGQRNGTSPLRNFTIQQPPTITLSQPSAGNRTANTTISFRYTPTDNSNALANCSVILDGLLNRTNSTITHGAVNTINVTGVTEGYHEWNITCTDPNGNTGTNISGRNFTVDLTAPSITLNYPGDGSFLNGDNITFNWTPIDTSAITLTCNISVTNGTAILNRTGIVGPNGTYFNTTFFNLAEGPHNWSVTCRDDVGNTNTSDMYTFSVNQADLQVNDTQLSVNSTNPAIGDTILLRANISNLGGVVTTGLIVSFWDGLPGIGTFIANATVNINPNQSRFVNASWNITPGYHTIWVIVDPANAIAEMDETNNNGSLNISAILANITSPLNGTVTADNTPQIRFNITDFTSGELGYRIFIDGVANGQEGTVAADSDTALDLSALADGYRRVIVQANDTLGRFRNSTAVTIIVDTTPPTPAFITRNGTYYNTIPFNVSIRINDTLDRDINYTIYVNSTANITGNVTNATATNVTLNGFTDGAYNLTVEGVDWAGNAANGTSIVILFDTVPPSIALNSPENGANLTARTALLNYTPTDAIDTVLECRLTLDGSSVQGANVSSGAAQTHTANNLAEGTHLWNATCWDGDNAAGQINNANTSETRSFTVSIPPNVTLVSPANGSITNNGTVLFLFNASDETGLANCSILIDGLINQTKTTAQLLLNGQNNFTVDGLNNTVLWAITCTDNSSGYATNTTGNRTLYVDLVAPSPVINTPSGTWFNSAAAAINITVTDNFDATLNITFYVDGNINTNGSAPNGTSVNRNLAGVPDGQHTLILQAYDDAGNYANSTSITINIDTVAPNVTLVSPANDTNLTETSAILNFTASDNLASVMLCNLTLDNIMVAPYNLTNGSYATYSTGDLLSGYHLWNATCIDNATNRGTSVTYRFYIELPDLVILDGNISVSNSTPIENQTIEVNATVSNIGLLNATNVTVQFWRGDPDAAGAVQIGANITIPLLPFGESVVVSVNYTTVVGLNSIYAVVDPPTAANGSIREQNETNNKGHYALLVGIYQVFAGGSLNELRIADNALIAAFTWNESNTTGSNVFVADTQSSITFTTLQAIGRNATNGTGVGTNDFEEIDIRLNITGLNESVNNTWTSGGQPHGLENITLFKRYVMDIPVVNSTNTTSFRTGILWDMSDGGNAYNRSQDIIFMTVMNQSQVGQYGTYDYEIKVPAPLRDYIVGGGTITFYAEIK